MMTFPHSFPSALRAPWLAAALLALALALAAPGAARAQGFPLGVRVDVPLDDVIAVTFANVNGDTIPDLLAAELNGSAVTLLPGVGGGRFGSRVDFAVPGKPYWIATGDLNGDGKPDLVTANATGGVSVLLGNGAGGFATHVDYPGPAGGSLCVVLADLNGDGKLDAVVANNVANNVSVYLGNGDGTFAPRTDFGVGLSPVQLAVGDVNGDGIPDVVVCDHDDGDVSVRFGNGAGGFGPRATYSVQPGPAGLVLTDFNHDGFLDLATCNDVHNDVSVRLGDGKGGFGPAATYPTSPYVGGIAAGDVNGDGNPDLVVSGGAPTNVVSVLPGDGAGGFGTNLDVSVGNGPAGVAVGDANGDGRFDIAVADFNQHALTLLQAAPMAGEVWRIPSVAAGLGSVSTMGDFSGDGLGDVAFVAGSDSVEVSIASPTGFQPSVGLAAGGAVSWIDAGDLGNGGPDLVAVDAGNKRLVQFRNPGSFGGAPPPTTASASSLGGGPRLFRFCPSGVAGAVVPVVASDGPVAVVLPDVNGILQDVQPLLTSPGSALDCSIAGGDVDVDGYGDIVVGGATNVAIVHHALLLPSNTTTFTPPAGGPYGVDIGDLNGDGKADLVVTSSAAASVLVYLNTGAGLPASPVTYALNPNTLPGTPCLPIRIGDLNGDGRPDITVISRIDSLGFVRARVQEFLGDGAGGFGPRIDVVALAFSDVQLGDVNGDGRLDVESAGFATILSPSATRATLAVAPATVTQGSTVTLTATVQPTHIVPPTLTAGSVRFYDGTTLLGTAPVSWSKVADPPPNPLNAGHASALPRYRGVATLTPVMADPGTRSLTAVYVGDGRRAGSITPAVTALVTAPPAAVPGAAAIAFSVAAERNPVTDGRVAVRFSLASAEPASIGLFDVAGRRLAVREVGAMGVGSHALELRAASGAALAPGVYFVRLVQGARTAVARLALVR